MTGEFLPVLKKQSNFFFRLPSAGWKMEFGSCQLNLFGELMVHIDMKKTP